MRPAGFSDRASSQRRWSHNHRLFAAEYADGCLPPAGNYRVAGVASLRLTLISPERLLIRHGSFGHTDRRDFPNH
jgi:hypothetical protein